jgi:uncharacterized protein YuzE
MFYFEREEVLHLIISDEEEANSVGLSPNITAELNEQGELIGIEILQASTLTSNSTEPFGKISTIRCWPKSGKTSHGKRWTRCGSGYLGNARCQSIRSYLPGQHGRSWRSYHDVPLSAFWLESARESAIVPQKPA